MLTAGYTRSAADMPRLILVRHAKSDWPHGINDFDRPLAARGVADAAVAASFLQSFKLDLALISPAMRTIETFKLLNLSPARTEFNPNIYEAVLGSLIYEVNQVEAENLMLVGHSPGMPNLAWYFANNHESLMAQSLRRKYPTLGIAVLESSLPFSQWTQGVADLVDFQIPRADSSNSDSD